MNIINKIAVCFLEVIFLLLMICCKQTDKSETYHNIRDRFLEGGKHYKGITISSEKYMEGLEVLEVTEREITFLIPSRKNKIKSYKCTACHTIPLVEMQVEGIKKAHWNIKFSHANEDTMNCTTCHDGNNMDHLKSLAAHTIDIDKSFKLCSQCHQEVYKDWVGGAHGKRIKSWASPRISMTCVNCHNPHFPRFDSRWPARFNTEKIKERK